MKRVVHFEIHARDLDRAQKFYGGLFGWRITDMGPQMGNYRLVSTGEDQPGAKWPGIDGGMVPRRGAQPESGAPVNAFVCTITVPDLAGTMEAALAAGGSVALDKMTVPGVGLLAYLKDPEGNIFGVLQPETPT